MKNRFKKTLIGVIAFIMAIQLTSCVGSFDATGYVKSTLDARYLQQYKDHAKFTGVDEKEIEKKMKDDTMRALKLELAGLSGLDEEDEKSYYDVSMEIYAKAKYTVKEAEKKKDNYLVKVEVTPLDTIQKFSSGWKAKAEEKYKGATETPSNKELLSVMIEYIRECDAASSYGEPSTIEVELKKNDAGKYTVSDNDSNKIHEALFPTGSFE